VVVADRPLSSARYADRDPRLEGLWRTDDGKYFYVVYGPGAHASILSFGRDKKGIDTGSWDIFVTRTPKHTYLNITARDRIAREQMRFGRAKGYAFAEYHFSWFGELSVSPVGGDAFSKAVEQKKLHGKNEFLTTTISRENPERIIALIENSKSKDVFIGTSRARKIGKP